MKIARFLIVFPLLGTPVAHAQVRADVQFDASVSIGGEPISSVDVFYDQLSPYGVWVDEPRLGRVFIPDQDGFVPYRVGHWAYTDVGMVWISNDPFAWATSHYGRWAFSPVYSRWVWLPDTEWGPAWVDWRESGDDFGWAPLAPTFVADYGYAPPIDSWHYCRADRIFEVDLVRYYEPRDRVIIVHRDARPIAERRTVGRTQVVVGPASERFRAHRVAVRTQRVDPRVVGRLSRDEVRNATARAQQRRAQIDAENQRRIERKPQIREVERKVEVRRPAQNPQQQREQRQEQREQRAQDVRQQRQEQREQQAQQERQRREQQREQQAQQERQRREQQREQQAQEQRQQRQQQREERAQDVRQQRQEQREERAQDVRQQRQEQREQRAQDQRDQRQQQQQQQKREQQAQQQRERDKGKKRPRNEQR